MKRKAIPIRFCFSRRKLITGLLLLPVLQICMLFIFAFFYETVSAQHTVPEHDYVFEEIHPLYYQTDVRSLIRIHSDV